MSMLVTFMLDTVVVMMILMMMRRRAFFEAKQASSPHQLKFLWLLFSVTPIISNSDFCILYWHITDLDRWKLPKWPKYNCPDTLHITINRYQDILKYEVSLKEMKTTSNFKIWRRPQKDFEISTNPSLVTNILWRLHPGH